MKGTTRKRGKTWTYQIYVGIDEKTGKANFITRGGFKTEKICNEALNKAIYELNNGQMVFNKEMTFGQFARYWIEMKEPSVEAITLNGYKQRINDYMIPHFEKVKLESLNELRIRKWMKWLFDRLSSGHAVDVFKMMRQMLEKAVKKHLINRNPFEDIETPKGSRKKMNVWNTDEMNRFLDHAKTSHYYPVFLIALSTGMRQSEILGLQWDAINFENDSISVRSTLEVHTKILKDRTKNESSIRYIIVNPEVMSYLKKHRLDQKQQRLLLGTAWTSNNLVCVTEVGTPMTARNVLRSLYSIIERAGVKRITFHEIRHTHATALLSAGLDSSIIQNRLGHKSIDITMDIYAHVTPNMQQQAADTIQKLLHTK